jgi:hypothetical protein
LGEIGSGGGRSVALSETASPLSTGAFAADSVTRTRCGVSIGGSSPSEITRSVILALALSRRS